MIEEAGKADKGIVPIVRKKNKEKRRPETRTEIKQTNLETNDYKPTFPCDL